MQTQGIIKTSSFLVRRTALLFAAVLLCCHVFVDYDRMKIKMINRVVPESLEALVAFSLNPSTDGLADVKRYLLYFKTVGKILPRSAMSQAMLGYCYYYLGDMRRAEVHFKGAAAINPNFFWFYYNLGVIQFRQGRYAQAQEYLQKAVECPPEEALAIINVSKIYRELNGYAETLGYNTEQGLMAGYRNAYEMLTFCHYHMEGLAQRDYQVRIF